MLDSATRNEPTAPAGGAGAGAAIVRSGVVAVHLRGLAENYLLIRWEEPKALLRRENFSDLSQSEGAQR
jgi:hypothetical protein